MKKKFLLLFICIIATSLFIFSACEEPENGDNGGAEYTVTFDTDGGSSVESQKVKPGSRLGDYTTPSKAGYHFKAWYYGDKEWSFDTDSVKGDMTLKATWTPIEYTITYYGAEDAVNKNPLTYNIETETIILKDCLQHAFGQTFNGWTDQNGNPITEIDTSKLTDISISANWTTYTLTTEANISGAGDHTPYVGEPISAETSITVTATPYKAYEFLGWYNGNEKLTDALSYTFDMPRDNITYTAKYKLYDGLDNFNFTTSSTSCTINTLKDTTVTELVIPACVTSIESGALYDCVKLTSISVDEDNDAYKSFEGNLYSKDGKTIVRYAGGKIAESFDIPNTVTKIGDGAFYQCENLKSITIPHGVKYIESFAFYHCTGLTDVAIPNTVSELGAGVFSWCTGITAISIPNTIIRIPFAAFLSCSNLASVTLELTLYEIGASAFEGCLNLMSINYRGSELLWSSIPKGSQWDYSTGNYTMTYHYKGE